jgi:drug/metabolite transporter (DMT)-like permease
VLAVALALGSSLSWGVSDFLGGLASRRLHLLSVMVLSQGTGLLLAAVVVALRGEPMPPGEDMLLAGLSGVAGMGGLAAFYRGLSVGVMSVVAPISATAASVPVLVGVLTGDRPSAIQVGGIALAMTGVVLASREQGDAAGARVAAGAGLALVAALGFGSFFVLMDGASDGDVFWAILVNRVVGVGLLVSLALVLRPSMELRRGDGRLLATIGVLDIGANTLFAAASTEGLVSLVGVVASLYPVVTVLLAHQVLHERLQRSQLIGVGAALSGVALITAG